MVGVPMPESESFSCSDPKVPDAQIRNSEVIKHMINAYLRWYGDVRMKSHLDFRSPMQYRRDLGLLAA